MILKGIKMYHSPSSMEGTQTFEGEALGLREEDERLDRAAHMPHRAFAGENRLDPRLESELGRLCFRGLISRSQYEAGVRYGNFVLLYLRSIGAPDPYGGDVYEETGQHTVINWHSLANEGGVPRSAPIMSRLEPDLSEDESFRRKLSVATARKLLRDAGKHCIRVVDRVAVYDEPLRDEELLQRGELGILRAGLSALSGEKPLGGTVIPFRRRA